MAQNFNFGTGLGGYSAQGKGLSAEQQGDMAYASRLQTEQYRTQATIDGVGRDKERGFTASEASKDRGLAKYSKDKDFDLGKFGLEIQSSTADKDRGQRKDEFEGDLGYRNRALDVNNNQFNSQLGENKRQFDVNIGEQGKDRDTKVSENAKDRQLTSSLTGFQATLQLMNQPRYFNGAGLNNGYWR